MGMSADGRGRRKRQLGGLVLLPFIGLGRFVNLDCSYRVTFERGGPEIGSGGRGRDRFEGSAAPTSLLFNLGQLCHPHQANLLLVLFLSLLRCLTLQSPLFYSGSEQLADLLLRLLPLMNVNLEGVHNLYVRQVASGRLFSITEGHGELLSGTLAQLALSLGLPDRLIFGPVKVLLHARGAYGGVSLDRTLAIATEEFAVIVGSMCGVARICSHPSRDQLRAPRG